MFKNLKTIYFDMDGTIADLYGIKNWDEKLRKKDFSVYGEATPLQNMKQIGSLCRRLQSQNIQIGIISWLSADTLTQNEKKEIRQLKKEWLKNNFPITFDKIHLVQYGTKKHYLPKTKDCILFDDNEKVRSEWAKRFSNQFTFDEKDIVKELKAIVESLS